MEARLNHGIEYDVTDAVAIDDLVKSLEAHARLTKSAAKLMADLIPGLSVDTRKVSVVYLSQQSPLKELFAVSLVLTYQDELEGEVPSLLEALTGAEIPEQYDTLVTVLIMLIAIYGISKVFDALFPERSKENIKSAQDDLARRAAGVLGLSLNRVIAAVEVLFTGKSHRVLVSASQKIFAPTRGQTEASIKNRSGEILISPSAVRDAQTAAGLPYEEPAQDTPETENQFFHDVRIILHAMDKDRKRKGWAGHCPDLFDDRIPMHLEKQLNPETIFGRDEIKGDILLMSEEDEEGRMKPREFWLVRAYL
ncbi:hypothetical protein [Martelella soudanensis]|uniref:hypothetical protein n=1 Tax=unclassified Martelella TaxID=2629616 RepID=UPI0015DE5E36|nr:MULTISPECIES: hypothetical protein [unclassified Martelella]